MGTLIKYKESQEAVNKSLENKVEAQEQTLLQNTREPVPPSHIQDITEAQGEVKKVMQTQVQDLANTKARSEIVKVVNVIVANVERSPCSPMRSSTLLNRTSSKSQLPDLC